MNDRNEAYLEEKIFKTLREKSGVKNETSSEMINLCNYIHWALVSGVKLNFDLTPEELMYIEIAIESSIYTDYGAYPELVYL